MGRINPLGLAVVACFAASTGHAAEQLAFTPPPAWVVSRQIPTTSAAPADAPIAILLQDQQIRLGPESIDEYSEVAFRIVKPEGLSAGNLSVMWNPAVEQVAVHKLLVRRGAEVIDVLASGQRFTTMRRETDLEAATLDGLLTATIHPEDLRDGDIIHFATSISRSDPVLRGHREAMFAQWNGSPVSSAFARVVAPAEATVRLAQSDGLPKAEFKREGDQQVVAFSAKDVQPLILPGNAPLRFQVGRLAEVSDFRDWGQAADLFRPLYETASQIPKTGTLRDEVEKIRAGSLTPKARAEAALKLVQGRIRYVALLLGQGSYVPANADQTWSRRFGDCKAKTVLLIGILRELGIAAEPVLVSTRFGDAIADRLPSIGLFDHVIARTQIDGKTYWLDGTRTGDANLEDIQVPDLGWALPMVRAAQLVRLQPAPLTQPNDSMQIAIDASAGVFSTVKITASQTLRGDTAVATNALVSAMSAEQRKAFFEEYWQSRIDFATARTTEGSFDSANRIYRLAMTGDGKIDWKERRFWIPNASLAFDPDFKRPAGPAREAPFTLAFPQYTQRTITIRMPTGYFDGRRLSNAGPVNETVAGTEYRRTFTVSGNTAIFETNERALVPEIPYAAALAAEARLRSLNDDDLALSLPAQYRLSDGDAEALSEAKLETSDALLARGNLLLNAGKFDDALRDFSAALEKKPGSVVILSDRALAYLWLDRLPEARADLEAAAKIEPGHAVLLRAQGLYAEKSDDCEAAVAAFTKAIEAEPGNPFSYGHRAECNSKLGEKDAAMADSAKALAKQPTWIDLRLLRANILVAKGDTKAAAEEADLLVKDNPSSNYAWVAAARIYARTTQREKATKAFDAAIALQPEPFIYLNRAQSRPFTDKAGRLADLEAALKLDPNDSDALSEKAEQIGANGDVAGAAAIYERLVAAHPGSDFYRERRAILQYKMGKTAEAETYFSAKRASAKTAVDFNDLCWTKATSSIALEAALQDCREALRLKPK